MFITNFMKKYMQILSKYKKKSLKYSISLCIFIFISFLYSCNKDDYASLGNNFISDSEKLNLDSISIPITITSRKIDSIINSNYYIPLGFLNDNVYGYSKASTAFQIKPEIFNIDFSIFDSIVSLKLQLHLISRYGDSLQTQKIDIYQLTTALDSTKAYYSNYNIPFSSLSLILANYEIKDTSSKLLIELPISFAQELINTDSINYSSFKKFIDFFKGFYITPSASNTGIGCINTLSFVTDNSKLIMEYYNKEKKDTLTFKFDSETIISSLLEHDYTTASSDLQNALLDNSFNEYSFIQGLGGIETKISLSPLDSLFKNKNVVINRAKLKLNVRNYFDIIQFPSPPQLYLIKYNESNEQILIRDLIGGAIDIYGGKYNSTDHCYNFNITAEIQSMLLSNSSYDFYLMPTPDRNAGFPNRVSLFGNSNDENQAKLEVYYSYK